MFIGIKPLLALRIVQEVLISILSVAYLIIKDMSWKLREQCVEALIEMYQKLYVAGYA